MDFNIDWTGVATGIIISALTYVFGGIFKLRIDLNQAFKKIRTLEGKLNGSEASNERVDEIGK